MLHKIFIKQNNIAEPCDDILREINKVEWEGFEMHSMRGNIIRTV